MIQTFLYKHEARELSLFLFYFLKSEFCRLLELPMLKKKLLNVEYFFNPTIKSYEEYWDYMCTLGDQM